MQGGKFGILGASILLFVVGVAIGAGVAANHHGSGESNAGLSTTSKILADLSTIGPNGDGQSATPYNLLDPLGITKNSDIVQAAIRFPKPKDYIKAAIRLSSEQFRIAINRMADLAKEADDSLNQMAVDDCKELMDYAIEELQESLTSVGECPLQYLAQRLVDLRNWLSAVLSYSHTCMDGFTKPQLQTAINTFLQSSILQTGQALTLVTAIPQILISLNINANPSFSVDTTMISHANPSSSSGTTMAGNANPFFSSDATMVSTANPATSSSTTVVGKANAASSSGTTMVGTSNAASSSGTTMVGNGQAIDDHRFPVWMPKADRKLLMSRQGRGGGGGSANPQPNAVVAKDGSGQYNTITNALDAYNPSKDQNGTRYVIYVKAGVYDEHITITRKQTNIFMYGDGPRKTIVTGRKCNRDGFSTFRTAPFAVVGNGFICKSMGFQNTAGPEGHQAVALRVQSDMSAFYNCRMDGYQDTLYTQAHRQFYSNCVITGTVDFIFGDAAAIIQNSMIIMRKPMDNQQNSVTAHGRTHNAESTGLVIQNCRIVAESTLESKKTEISSYLGRPWKPYSRTVIMESAMGDFIRPEGWMPWAGNFGLDTCDYAEYANHGPGADTSKRVNWKGYHVITNANEAMKFTVERFIQGNQWLPATGAPYFLGLRAQ